MNAEVVAVDREHVVVLCPYCGEFHWHGSNGDITKQDYGTRLLHCIDVDRGSYELVTTEKPFARTRAKFASVISALGKLHNKSYCPTWKPGDRPRRRQT